jgi:hypothetical protein
MKTQQEAPTCERKDELLDYLYDELPVAQRAQFAEHLQACTSCHVDLDGMQQLRSELRSWDLGAVPRLELVIPRSKLEVLKELLSLFPVWSRALLATTGTAALVLIALGTVSLFKQTEAPAIVVQGATAPSPVEVLKPAPVNLALTPEMRQVINSEVAKAVEAERQALRAQLAAVETRHRAQQVQLQTVTRQLRELNTRHQQLLAAQQPSLRSIFAEYEPSSER